MRWDESGDVEFSNSLDLAITAGQNLIQQRIMVRLKMMRGWIYDRTGTLGSRLNISLSEPITEGLDDIPGLVLEALDPMSNEILVEDISVQQSDSDPKTVVVIVSYHLLNSQPAPVTQTVTFPLTA